MPTDLDGLAAGEILRQARSLHEWPAGSLPEALLAASKYRRGRAGRGNRPAGGRPGRRGGLCAHTEAPAVRPGARRTSSGKSPACRRPALPNTNTEIVALWERKKHLLHRMETLTQGVS